jgi:hypothetical protein
VVNDALFSGELRFGEKYLGYLLDYHLYRGMISRTGAGAGLVVDGSASCAKNADKCLSCLIDTSGGSDDGFVQSHTNAVVQVRSDLSVAVDRVALLSLLVDGFAVATV